MVKGVALLMVMFTHTCPHCGRKRRLQIALLGHPVACIQCHRESVAADRDNESEAMYDTVKAHAELATAPNVSNVSTRLPR